MAPQIPASVQPISSSLTLAELSMQRGEYEQSRAILEKRIGRGADDFKTLNLYGISLAHSRNYDNAATVFKQLKGKFRGNRNRTSTAGFNLGLVSFYRDLAIWGDLSVSRTITGLPAATFAGRYGPSHRPFDDAIVTWRKLLSRKQTYSNIINTYLAFALLQSGDMIEALERLQVALNAHDTMFITHYVFGRIFLDLYFLAVEGNDFPLSKSQLAFFEIEQFEILKTVDDRFQIQPDTFLDIGMQAFMEGRTQNPLSPEILLGLAQAYMLAGMIEEAAEALSHAEMLAPDSLPIMETNLMLHEQVQAPPEMLKSMVNHIKRVRDKNPSHQVNHILPSYFLF